MLKISQNKFFFLKFSYMFAKLIEWRWRIFRKRMDIDRRTLEKSYFFYENEKKE